MAAKEQGNCVPHARRCVPDFVTQCAISREQHLLFDSHQTTKDAGNKQCGERKNQKLNEDF